MKAIILAAGRGERLRPLTDTVPKPLVPVAGKPLISYHLEALARAGVSDVVINLSWLGDRIRESLGDGQQFGVRIRYSDEGPVALETGGGIFNALPLLGPDPFLVVNGDVWTDIDLASLVLRDDADGFIVLVTNPAHNLRGDFGLDGDSVVSRDTAAERSLSLRTYSGVALYRPQLFEGSTPGKFPLAPLLNRAIAAGRLRGKVHTRDWYDIGSPARLAQVDALARARLAVQ